jgi:DNA-binding NarL/FixJ family response regulator
MPTPQPRRNLVIEHLTVSRPGGTAMCPLTASRITIGRAAGNTITIPDDTAVSRLHAVIEKLADRWCIRDMASRNGTHLNGRELRAQAPLYAADEIRIGETTMIAHLEPGADDTTTHRSASMPDLTVRERAVLLSLLRPAIDGADLTRLASAAEIAEALGVTEAAVRHHFLGLYLKFGIDGHGSRRQVRLADEALRRGSVSPRDVRTPYEERISSRTTRPPT